MSTQFAPAASQRRHWRANDVGEPDHVPVSEVSDSPCFGVPVIAGAAVIASFHDFDGTPDDLPALMDRICASPGQIAKLAAFVNSWSDNRRLLDVLSGRWPKPVIVAGRINSFVALNIG